MLAVWRYPLNGTFIVFLFKTASFFQDQNCLPASVDKQPTSSRGRSGLMISLTPCLPKWQLPLQWNNILTAGEALRRAPQENLLAGNGQQSCPYSEERTTPSRLADLCVWDAVIRHCSKDLRKCAQEKCMVPILSTEAQWPSKVWKWGLCFWSITV